MKALFIGGTGTISTAITRRALSLGWEVWLLNRGTRACRECTGVRTITGDINGDEATLSGLLGEHRFDAVVDFIAFVPEQLERDVRLFAGRTAQFIFISSASAYQKPLSHYLVSESTPLCNPLWEYSRNKIACEEYLVHEWRSRAFPVTIVRPSHTYDDQYLPVAIHGKRGAWQVVDRIVRDKPVLVPGDGTSLWTVTHAEDFARAFCGLLGNRSVIGEIFHITGGETLSWNQIYDCIGAAVGKEVIKYHVSSDFLAACDPEYTGTLLGDKAHSVVFDNAKIQRVVRGFTGEISFQEGSRRCVNYLLSNPALQARDPEFELFCEKVIAAQEAARIHFFSAITG